MRIRYFFVVLSAALLLGGGNALAQNVKAQESKKAALEKEINQINSLLRDNSAKSRSAMSELNLVQKKVEARKALVQESDKEIAELDSDISALTGQIAVIQDRLDTLSEYYTRLVRNAYKNRDSRIWYMYILASENLPQALRRYAYLRDLSAQMNVQAEKIIQTKEELERETLRLDSLRSEASIVRDGRQAELQSLQAEEKQSKDLVKKLQKDRNKYQQQLKTKQNQVAALQREIEKIIREATGGKGSGGSKSSTTKTSEKIDYKLAGEFAANKGKLPWPVEGTVTESYGQHYHPVYKGVKLPFNNGVTLAVRQGAKVEAVFNGTVKKVAVMPGFNQCVIVQHGNYFTLYCNMGSVQVKSGDNVKTGQTIGTVESTSGDNQFHFELWADKNPQNPELWLVR